MRTCRAGSSRMRTSVDEDDELCNCWKCTRILLKLIAYSLFIQRIWETRPGAAYRNMFAHRNKFRDAVHTHTPIDGFNVHLNIIVSCKNVIGKHGASSSRFRGVQAIRSPSQKSVTWTRNPYNWTAYGRSLALFWPPAGIRNWGKWPFRNSPSRRGEKKLLALRLLARKQF